jgi:glycosyltransferase 2 family protein
MNRAIRLLGYTITAIALLALGLRLRTAWPLRAGLTIWAAPALLSFICAVVALFLHAMLWGQTLRLFGARLGPATTARVWFVAQVMRYAPGNIWYLFGRAYLAQREGVDPKLTSASALLELLQTSAAAVLVGSLSLPYWHRYGPITLSVLLAPPLLLLCAQPSLLHRFIDKLPKPQAGSDPGRGNNRLGHLILLPGYCMTWVAHGWGLYLLIRSVHPLELAVLPTVTSMFALAWLIGFLSIITPSGLGVREGALSYLLSSLMPAPTAILVALLSRVWLTVAELICVAIALLASYLAQTGWIRKHRQDAGRGITVLE